MELSKISPAMSADVPPAGRAASNDIDEVQQILGHWARTTGAVGAALIERTETDEPALLCTFGVISERAKPQFARALRRDHPFPPGGRLSRLRPSGSGGPEILFFAPDQGSFEPELACLLLFESDIDARLGAIRAAHAGIAPMLQAFFRLWRRHRAESRRSEILRATLDVNELGIVLLGRHCEILFANEGAERLLAARDGISRTHGALRATHLSDGVSLHTALGYAEDRSSGAGDQRSAPPPLLSFRRAAAPPLIATLHPMPAQIPLAEDAVAILTMLDPQIDSEQSVAPLCRLHGLSRVETALVCRLTEGTTLSEAATAMRIREQTARGYLKQIFVKTGTRRQTELVARMLGSLIRVRRNGRERESR